MAKSSHGMIKAPDQALQGLAATRSQIDPASKPKTPRADVSAIKHAAGGSANLTPLPSPIKPADHCFDIKAAAMRQPAAAVEPGKGAVPINPFLACGPGLARATTLSDDAKPR